MKPVDIVAAVLVTAAIGYYAGAMLVGSIFPAGIARVIDGDTIETTAGERLRIVGYDAPELSNPRCAREAWLAENARRYLENRLRSGRVTITRRGTDRYGRTLAVVEVDGEDIAREMIAADLGVSYAGGRRDPNRWCAP